jgi:single-strand DNA-binding protein
MANLNRVLLIGNLTRDVELKSIGSGQQVAKISIATNRRWTGQDGQQKEEVTFVDCEAWGKTAEMMARYLSKGRPVFIEGRLKLDKWQDKESGQNRSKMAVVIENFQFVDSKPGSGGGGGGSGDGEGGGYSRPAPRQSQASPQQSQGGDEPPMNDDIPF